jgi:hypothetical protein
MLSGLKTKCRKGLFHLYITVKINMPSIDGGNPQVWLKINMPSIEGRKPQVCL